MPISPCGSDKRISTNVHDADEPLRMGFLLSGSSLMLVWLVGVVVVAALKHLFATPWLLALYGALGAFFVAIYVFTTYVPEGWQVLGGERRGHCSGDCGLGLHSLVERGLN
jgi:hypothetical protein